MWERVERFILGLMVTIAVGELGWVSYVFSVRHVRGLL